MSLALTFDDGPDPRATPAVLDELSHAGATATFFVLAPRAAAAPELIGRMREEGHTVALHAHEHVRHTERSPEWLRADTARALARLAEHGIRPDLWRAPWGVLAPWTATVAAEQGLRLLGWSVDTHDWRGDRAADMFEVCRERLCDGAVVLAHDGIGPGALRAEADETVTFTRLALEHARRQGLVVEAL